MAWCEKTGQGPATLWDMWTMLLPVGRRTSARRSCARSAPTPSSPRRRCSSASSSPTSSTPPRNQFVPRLDSPGQQAPEAHRPAEARRDPPPPGLALDRRRDPKPRRARRLRLGRRVRRGLGEGAAPVHPPHGPPRADPPAGAARGRSARGSRSRSTRRTCSSPATFARMLAMDRSAGLECTAAWQSLGQIEDRDLRSIDPQPAPPPLRLLARRRRRARDDAAAPDRLRRRRPRRPGRPRAAADHPRRADQPAELPLRLLVDRGRRAGSRRSSRRRCRWSRTTRGSSATSRTSASAAPTTPGRSRRPTGSPTTSRCASTCRATNGAGAATDRRRNGAAADRPPAAAERHRRRDDAARARRPTSPPSARAIDDGADRTGVAPLGSPVGRSRCPTPTPSSTSRTSPACAGSSRRPARTSRRCRAATTSRCSPRSTSCASCSPPRSAGASWPAARCAPSSTASTRCTGRLAAALRDHDPRPRAQPARLLARRAGLRAAAARTPAGPSSRATSTRTRSGATTRSRTRASCSTTCTRTAGCSRSSSCCDPRSCAAGAARARRSSTRRARRSATSGSSSRPDRVPLGTGQHLSDLQLDEFQPVRPDLAIELDLSLEGAPRRVELLLELDRTDRASANLEKFRRYDALLTGWALSPAALQDARRAADRRLRRRGRTEGAPVPQGRRPARHRPDRQVGRARGRLAAPRPPADVRGRRARCARRDPARMRLPEHPPEMRRSLGGRRQRSSSPEQIPSLVPTPFLR